MKKFLLSLFALIALTANAQQEVVFDFSSKEANPWGLPEGSTNKGTEEQTFTNGNLSIKVSGAGYYLGTSTKDGEVTLNGYLLMGKKGAYIEFPAFNFKVGKIEFVGNSGASANVQQNIYVGETAVSSQTTGATSTNIYDIDAANQAAGTIYRLVVENAYNTQIKQIIVHEVGASTKQAAGLSFSASSVSVTADKINEFVAPTLTKATDAPLTWSSTNENIASVDGNGNVTLTGTVGQATIKVAAEETETYYAGTSQYTVIVKEAEQGGGDTPGTTVTIAETYSLKDKAAVTLGAFDVVYVNGAYIYIKDATASGLLYKGDYGLKAGDHVAAGLAGTISIYQNLYEIKPTTDFAELTVTSGTAPAPVEATAAPSKDNVNQYVIYKGVTFDADDAFTSEVSTTIVGKWNGESINFFNKFKIAQEFKVGQKYDIVATTSIYKEDLQAYFLSATSSSTGINAVVADSDNAPAYNLAGQRVAAGYKGTIIINGKKYIQK